MQDILTIFLSPFFYNVFTCFSKELFLLLKNIKLISLELKNIPLLLKINPDLRLTFIINYKL